MCAPLCCVIPPHFTPPGDESGAEEMRKEMLKSKAKLLAAMQRQGGNIERPDCWTLPVHPLHAALFTVT